MSPNYDTTRRKWVTQMVKDEKRVLRCTVRAYGSWTFSPHALREMEVDGISQADALEVIKSGRVLEVHNCNKNDICVLVRGIIGERSVAIVVSLINGRIVTAFANTIENGARQPDMRNYRWFVDATKFRQVSEDNLVYIS